MRKVSEYEQHAKERRDVTRTNRAQAWKMLAAGGVVDCDQKIRIGW
jgi:hypothetical protein